MRVADADIIKQRFKIRPLKKPFSFGGGGTVNSASNKEFSPINSNQINNFTGAQNFDAQNYGIQNPGTHQNAQNTYGIAPGTQFAPLNSENLRAFYASDFSNISFGATRISKKSFPLTKYHDEISCPCCGEKMVNFDWQEAETFAKSISKKRGDELASALLTNINEFQYSKRTLVEKLAGAAPKYPEKNISELLGVVSGEYIDSLRKKQKNIVYQMADELRNRKPSQKAAFTDWQNWQIERIMDAQNEGDFKNSRLIKSFISLAGKHNIHLSDKKINSYYDRLPNSKKDIDAFVIKYQRRKPYETTYEFLKNTTPTVEHIVPFSKSEDNNYGNLLLMCSDCNNARGNTKYSEFLNLYPEMKQNIDKYFKDIEKLVQKKDDYKLKGMYKSYIRDVKRTLKEYTNGRLCNDDSAGRHTKKRSRGYKH